VALLPWGDVIEDFLDGIGVSLETFANEMTGGWLFGYVEALKRTSIRTVVICVSKRVDTSTRYTHEPTGAAIWVLPAPNAYLRLRKEMLNPYGWSREDMFGDSSNLNRVVQEGIRSVAPYLSTPWRSLASVLGQENARAILCQEYEYPRFDVAIRLGARLNLPVFATFQGGDWQISRIERWVRPRSMRAASGLIIPTTTEAARVKSTYGVPDAKIARVFNPLDIDAWVPPARQDVRQALGYCEDAELVVWHGRVDLHRKGLDVLLDAWAKVVRARTDRNLQLLLVGNGPSAAELRVRLAVEERVRWIDEYVLDRVRLRHLLAAADVYAFPSRHEGFPVALVEALASGLPVVATDAPGVPDIFGGQRSFGVMVPRDDASAFAAALGGLLDHPGRAALARAARARAEEAFSLESVGTRLAAVLFSDGQH
jgi:starch synthase